MRTKEEMKQNIDNGFYPCCWVSMDDIRQILVNRYNYAEEEANKINWDEEDLSLFADDMQSLIVGICYWDVIDTLLDTDNYENLKGK